MGPEGARQAHLFRAERPEGPLVVKTWAPEAAERARAQARRQSELAPALQDGPCRVPAVHFFDEDHLALAMQAVPGHDLATLWQDRGDPRLARAAGHWLRALHGLSLRETRFDPKGQVNWLDRLVAAGEAGNRAIPDLPGFTRAARAVQARMVAAAGRSATRAITHRDMTLSNLMLDASGTVWGLDVENRREDEPLRDLFTLALDLATLGPGDAGPGRAALIAGYGDAQTHPLVRLALQGGFALWVWANTPARPSRRQIRRLAFAERVLADDAPLI
ncbi:hypothetical protein AVJ23_01000 [Pseudoponticoccus marisrubri]|uniref:Aminoglycoside phosphotransferase domain-containing protein n=2 Tax=Pseudoponticoccus marisrubri TaxID=1685382 RepID=A0A0W7WP06_9RHOB|nr:hypothetical protein AVJ23_01000 [Pseudoponticoccus marisrubri]